MAISVPLRHELKFYINPLEAEVLRRVLDRTMHRDPNGDENNEYHIRSLYFDTRFNDALIDKLDGVKNRDKYRIRIYNGSLDRITLECKEKKLDRIVEPDFTVYARLRGHQWFFRRRDDRGI